MSFSKGFLSAAVAKALTPQAVGAFKNSVFLQGIAVASVGGIASSLAGGSFEHGFLAAGVAFAVNQLTTSIDAKLGYSRKFGKVVNLAGSVDKDGVAFLARAQADGGVVKATLDSNGNLKYTDSSGRVHITESLPLGELKSIGVSAGAVSLNFSADPSNDTITLNLSLGKSFGSVGGGEFNARISLTINIDVASAVFSSRTFGPAARHLKYGSTRRLECLEANGYDSSGC
jgi:hypothetical protein